MHDGDGSLALPKIQLMKHMESKLSGITRVKKKSNPLLAIYGFLEGFCGVVQGGKRRGINLVGLQCWNEC